MDEVRLIPVSDLVEPRSLLRLVDRNAIEYLELRDSVAQFGFTSSIAVRPSKLMRGKFEIIEGIHRYSVAGDLGIAMMPCLVKPNVNDQQLLILQLQGNAQGVPTRGVEYARQLKAILAGDPEMDINGLSVRLKKSPAWIKKILGILILPKEVQESITRGDIPLQSAFLLSKIPRRVMWEVLNDSKTLPVRKFAVLAAAKGKQFREALAHGRLEDFYTHEFTPTPYLRHLKEIQAEMAHHQAGPELVASLGCRTPLDGFYAALQWFIHSDPESLKVQRAAALARERTHLETLDVDTD